jgi:MFS family permease
MTKKDFYIASLSALVQYYEYHLFGFLAAAISKNFFFESDPSSRLLKTYVIMFIGVCAKPVGALLLGRIGDVYGRQKAINIAISVTAAASFVIGILPGYAMIGVLSAFILLLMRMCIASCSSSGTDGVRLYIYEKISSKRKNLAAGLTTISTVGGSLVASLSAWFFTLSNFAEYYWRYAFLLGSVAGLLVTLLRSYGDLSQDIALKQENKYEQYKNMSLFKIVRQNLKLFMLVPIQFI